VIEAVFESLAGEAGGIRFLGANVPSWCGIGFKHSTLDIDVIAAASGRERDVVGMHFFSPAEHHAADRDCARRSTAPEVIATARDLSRRMGKLGSSSATASDSSATHALRLRP